MMKLKMKFKDGWHLPIFQGHWLIREKVCHHDISALTICIMKFKDGWQFTYLSRSLANKGKSLSSRYHRTYNLYYEVQRWVTFTYLSKSLANKGKRLSSRYLRTYNLYYFHNNTSDPYMIKLKVNFTYLSRSQMLMNLVSYNLYRFSIDTIDRTDKTVCQIRR